MQAESGPETAGRGEIGLPALVLWLGLFGAALYLLTGWPTALPALPASWPSWLVVEVWLRSPILPTEWLIPLVRVVAWLVWGWTCLTVVLRVVLHVLEVITQGAAWVRSLRVASDWLTVRFVRGAVDASLAGLLMARVVVPAPAMPHAAGSEVVIASSVGWGSRTGVPARPPGGAGLVFGPMERTADSDGQSTTAVDELVYTIQRGGTWSGIALTFYGTAGPRAFEAAEPLLRSHLEQTYGAELDAWVERGLLPGLTWHLWLREPSTIREPSGTPRPGRLVRLSREPEAFVRLLREFLVRPLQQVSPEQGEVELRVGTPDGRRTAAVEPEITSPALRDLVAQLHMRPVGQRGCEAGLNQPAVRDQQGSSAVRHAGASIFHSSSCLRPRAATAPSQASRST